MLTADELEAAVLGAQWVAGHADASLARAAQDLIAKIAAAVPERLRPFVQEPAGRPTPSWNLAPDGLDMAQLRHAIREGLKVRLDYADEQGRASARVVWPFAIGYMDATRLLAAWCELRGDFRTFRTDRVRGADFLDARYPEGPALLRARWRKARDEQRALAERAAPEPRP
jgi:predicted DNA-binding transcriptional regulator YafY